MRPRHMLAHQGFCHHAVLTCVWTASDSEAGSLMEARTCAAQHASIPTRFQMAALRLLFFGGLQMPILLCGHLVACRSTLTPSTPFKLR